MVLRAGFLWLSDRQGVQQFAQRNPIAKRFAQRFVAGETLDEVLVAAGELNGEGLTTSLDLLGENVTSEAESRQARDECVQMLNAIAEQNIDGNISIKLSQMGLDLDEELCVENASAILDRAAKLGTFVRIDMENSAYTERTLRLFYDAFHPIYGNGVGVVIQSYLRRSRDDIDDLIRLGARVRLCKGAYLEPETVAFLKKSEVDRNFVVLLERLLDEGTYPGIATHDELMIEQAKRYVEKHDIPTSRYEFQMIYGVRRDQQRALRKQGYNMRVYIPFGAHWYPYFMRRLAERPANVAFILTNLVRETLSRP